MKTKELTPYERGWRDRLAGIPVRHTPRGDASWAEKLYFRGWSDAAREFSK